MSFQTLNLANC